MLYKINPLVNDTNQDNYTHFMDWKYLVTLLFSPLPFNVIWGQTISKQEISIHEHPQEVYKVSDSYFKCIELITKEQVELKYEVLLEKLINEVEWLKKFTFDCHCQQKREMLDLYNMFQELKETNRQVYPKIPRIKRLDKEDLSLLISNDSRDEKDEEDSSVYFSF